MCREKCREIEFVKINFCMFGTEENLKITIFKMFKIL